LRARRGLPRGAPGRSGSRRNAGKKGKKGAPDERGVVYWAGCRGVSKPGWWERNRRSVQGTRRKPNSRKPQESGAAVLVRQARAGHADQYRCLRRAGLGAITRPAWISCSNAWPMCRRKQESISLTGPSPSASLEGQKLRISTYQIQARYELAAIYEPRLERQAQGEAVKKPAAFHSAVQFGLRRAFGRGCSSRRLAPAPSHARETRQSADPSGPRSPSNST